MTGDMGEDGQKVLELWESCLRKFMKDPSGDEDETVDVIVEFMSCTLVLLLMAYDNRLQTVETLHQCDDMDIRSATFLRSNDNP
jgi:hypothetical protein